VATEVEVLIRMMPDVLVDQAGTVSDFLRSLPIGNRSKEEIDRDLHAERASWGDR
jgi:hypothetical protein